MRKIIIIQFLFLNIFFFHYKLWSQDIYASTSGGNIYKLNLENCSSTFICNGPSLSDIATDNCNLYGVYFSAFIFSINKNSCNNPTYLAQAPWNSQLNALVGDDNGYLYAVGLDNDTIYRYNINSNVFSRLGTVNYPSGGDLAIKNGNLYMLSLSSRLIKININPFSYSVIGILNVNNEYAYGLVSVPSADTTILYVSTTNGSNTSSIYKINEYDATATIVCSNLINLGGYITGLSSYCNPDDIKEILSKNIIAIYPNPVVSQLTIETAFSTNESKLIICNTNGKELIRQQIKSTKTQLDISNLKSGIYFLKLINNKTVEVRKIIKE